MRTSNLRSIALGIGVVGGLLGSAVAGIQRDTPADEAPTAEDLAQAGELFRSSCASCHLPPNPDYATDRAWLGQVKDTA